jgi:hypothetical protein
MTAARRVVVLLAAALATPAHASPRPPKWLETFGALLHYELAIAHELDTAATAPRFHDLGLAGAHVRGFAGTRHVVYQIGLDLSAGATTHSAGFAWDVALLPVGVALRFGDDQLVGIAAGIGGSGATGTLPAALAFPVEASAELQLGARVRVLAQARATWLDGAPVRAGGAALGDQLDALLALRLGHRYREYGIVSGNGYYVGATYHQVEDARFIGVAIGYSVDLVNARSFW